MLGKQFCNLHGVGRGPLAQVVRDQPEDHAVLHGGVHAHARDEYAVVARRLQRRHVLRRVLGHHHAGLRLQRVDDPRDRITAIHMLAVMDIPALDAARHQRGDGQQGDRRGHAGQLRARPCRLGDRRTRVAAADGEPVEQTGGDVDDTQRRQLLVAVDALVAAQGHAARQHTRVGERHEGHAERRAHERHADELGIDLQVTGPEDGSAESQLALIQGLADSGVQGIATSVPGATLAEPLNAIIDSGIPIVQFNLLDTGVKAPYVGERSVASGRMLGKAVIEKMGGADVAEGKVAVGNCFPGFPVLENRQRGVLEALAEAPGITVVGPLPPAIQVTTIFSGAVATTAAEPALAAELIKRDSAYRTRFLIESS